MNREAFLVSRPMAARSRRTLRPSGLGNGLSLDSTSFDLHDRIAESLDEVRFAHPAATLTHERRGEGACTADVNRVVQALRNLVSNAVTYGQPEAPITVTSAVEARSFSIVVHNWGTPISPEAKTTLFDPVTRVTLTAPQSRRQKTSGA